MNRLIVTIACVVFFATAMIGCSASGNENQQGLPCVSNDPGSNNATQSSISNDSGLPVVMKVGRTTCIPCRKMSKLLTEMEPKLSSKAKVEIVDIDEDPDAVKRFAVTGIPVTIFFDVSGKEIYRQIGLLEEKEIIQWLSVAGMKQ
jgi:thioredoxin 1